MNSKLISKYLAAIAIFSLLFFPVAGCGGGGSSDSFIGSSDSSFTGVQILKKNGIQMVIKLFFIVSILCGVVIFFFKRQIEHIVSAIGGIVSLVIAYVIACDKFRGIDLKVGSYLGLLCYIAIIVVNRLEQFKKIDSSNKETQDNIQMDN